VAYRVFIETFIHIDIQKPYLTEQVKYVKSENKDSVPLVLSFHVTELFNNAIAFLMLSPLPYKVFGKFLV